MLEITWLGHGTFKLRLESGEVLILDPWIANNPAYPKDYVIDRIDALLVTHCHYDHIEDTVALAKNIPQVAAIFGLACGSVEGRRESVRDELGGHSRCAGRCSSHEPRRARCGILVDGKVLRGEAAVMCFASLTALALFRG
jgi:glyoxylase-like metal-dependent hydrolase (beta-lactamase superfamily II)